MSAEFFEQPILNSPYEEPKRHWALTSDGQPTQLINEERRPADFVTPIPKPRKLYQQLMKPRVGELNTAAPPTAYN